MTETATSTTEPARKPAVYVIAPPALRKSKRWPKVRGALKAKSKGAWLVTYDDLFGDVASYEAEWRTRLPQCAGALVVPLRHRGGLWLGNQARAEAELMLAAGRPVLVLVTSGLLPWSEVAAVLTRPQQFPRGLPNYLGPWQPAGQVTGMSADLGKGDPAGRSR